MDRGEVAEGLQQIRQQPCFSDMRYVSLGLLDAAIALIEPQPVTEDALREAGFENNGDETFTLDLSDRIYPYISYRGGRFCLHTHGVPVGLHITDMQHLRSVIAALRGREIEVAS